MSDLRQQFVEALRAHGLALSDPLVADGQIHRCNVAGKGAHGVGDGSYLLHLHGEWAAGGFQDWTDIGGWQKWLFVKHGWQPTVAEQREIDAAIERAKGEAAKQLAKARAEARVKARGMWKAAKRASASYEYCQRKRVKPEGLRIYEFENGDCVLLVPIYDANEKLASLQMIFADGTKRFLAGGRVGVCHYWVAHPDEVDDDTTICIAEGWATGETIYQATGYATLIAFDAGNLRAVAQWARSKYPDARIILCADDDRNVKGNPGLTAANEAARAVNGRVAKPDFGREELAS